MTPNCRSSAALGPPDTCTHTTRWPWPGIGSEGLRKLRRAALAGQCEWRDSHHAAEPAQGLDLILAAVYMSGDGTRCLRHTEGAWEQTLHLMRQHMPLYGWMALPKCASRFRILSADTRLSSDSKAGLVQCSGLSSVLTKSNGKSLEKLNFNCAKRRAAMTFRHIATKRASLWRT